MFGGGFANGEGGGIADLGISNDSELSLYTDIHLSGALSAIFGRQSWGRVQGDPVQAMWTGNMAFSTDGFPWVGRLPRSVTHRRSGDNGNGAEWICAAYGGEGMVQAWMSGKALAIMVLSQDDQLVSTADADLSWVPEQILVTEKRIIAAELPRFIGDRRLERH